MMKFTQKSIKGLFDSSEKSYEIPVYQRAYSWDDRERKVFLEDLIEQRAGGNTYCYGNILLETIKQDELYEVIDGQQRLTTLTIFIRAVINVLRDRAENDNSIEEKVNLDKKERIYFKNDGVIKLRPVDYDRACYDTLIIENKNEFCIETPSQKRIKTAKDYFIKELSSLNTSEIIKIFTVLEEAQVNCIELEGKKDSALMFELQNNRGKELTNLEKLKSFLMYQLYVVSSEKETDTNIEYVSNKFDPIYRIINDLRQNMEEEAFKDISEDSIFIYHCNAYTSKGFTYRNLDDFTNEYKSYKGNKVDWIKNFADELYTTYSNVKFLQSYKNYYLNRLLELGMPRFVYPFIIKGMKFFKEDDEKMNQLFRTMEVLSFRYKLINSRSDLIGKLNSALREFEGDTIKLNSDMHDLLNNHWYWSDERVESYLDDDMYHNSMINYILHEYERSLQPKGYELDVVRIENEQIEHISPKTEDEEWIQAGYEVDENNKYSNEFKEGWLNSLGNLMLISGSHNASIGNKPFKEKLDTYNRNPLLKQQAEIKDFAYIDEETKEIYWYSGAISDRHDKLLEFATTRWSF